MERDAAQSKDRDKINFFPIIFPDFRAYAERKRDLIFGKLIFIAFYSNLCNIKVWVNV